MSVISNQYNDFYTLCDERTGEPLVEYEYTILRSDGSTVQGKTDANGCTKVQKNHDVEAVEIRVKAPKWEKAQ